MAQQVVIAGALFNDVPAISVPDSNNVYHSFIDTTIANNAASAADIANGKLAYVNGSLVTGTGSGGGSNWTLIKSITATVNTTSTTASTATTISCDSSVWTDNYILWVHIRGQSGKRPGYFYGSDAIFANWSAANNGTTTDTSPAIQYIRVNSDGTYMATTGSYGVYAYSVANNGTIVIRRRYSNTLTLTINDTFNIDVYLLSLPTGKTVFD